MKTLYTNGCSFSSRSYDRKGNMTVDTSWPYILGDMLKYNVVNNSQPSGSNDRIYRTSLEWLTENILEYPLVIIQPTHSVRREFYSHKSSWLNFKNDSYTWHKYEHEKEAMILYEKFFMFDFESLSRTLSQIFTLQKFLETNSITYYFLETRYCKKRIFNEHPLSQTINWNKWLHNNFDIMSDKGNFDNIRHLYHDIGHLNYVGHKKMAEEIFQEIRNHSEIS